MTHTKEDLITALAIIKRHQDWRRGADIEPSHPTELGHAIDIALSALQLAIDLQPRPIEEA